MAVPDPPLKIAFLGIQSHTTRAALKECLRETGHRLLWNRPECTRLNRNAGGAASALVDEPPPDIIITPAVLSGEALEQARGSEALVIGIKEIEGLGVPSLWGDEVCGAFLPPRPEPGVFEQAVAIAFKRREDSARAGEDRMAVEKIRDELEAGERERAALLETIPAAVYFKNTELEYVTANKTFSDWIGIPLEKIPGRTDHDFFPWEVAEKYRLDDTEVIVKGEIKSNIDEIIPGADGGKRWVSTSKTPFRDVHGRILGMVGISIDITLRKRMENVLRELAACVLGFTPDCNENIRSLLSLSIRLLSAEFGIYLRKRGDSYSVAFQTSENEHLDVYTRFCRTLDEWMGDDRSSDLLFIPDLEKIPEELGLKDYTSFLGRRIETGEHDAGFLGCFFTKAYNLSDMDGQIIHLVVSAAGIEEQRRLSEEQVQLERNRAEAASRAKSEFLAHMSHEFKTPLNGILGYAQILRKGAETEAQFKHGIEVIERGANHLSKLIEDILDLSAIEAGKLTVRPALVVIEDFLKDISSFFQPRIEEKELRFSLEVGEDVPCTLRTDEKRLRQVLLNLLGNAVKYTEAGSIVLSVQVYGGKIRFTVRDTGTGIPPAELESIFSPFVQLEQPGKSPEGTGLGLYISKKILEEIGSAINLESAPGEGSRFWFDLPRTDTEGEKSEIIKEEPAPSKHSRAREPAPRSRGQMPGSKEDLELLYRLVNVGDIGEVRTTVDRLLVEGVLDREFAQTLLKYCGRYNIEKLKEYIIEYLR